MDMTREQMQDFLEAFYIAALEHEEDCQKCENLLDEFEEAAGISDGKLGTC